MATSQVVELNVGGHLYTTTKTTLCKVEDSMLAKMFSGDLPPAYRDSQGRFFLDRDGSRFATVLTYLRGDPVDIPVNAKERSALRTEASYYQVGKQTSRTLQKLSHLRDLLT